MGKSHHRYQRQPEGTAGSNLTPTVVDAATPAGQEILKDMVDGLRGKVPEKVRHAVGLGEHVQEHEVRLKLRLTPVCWAIPLDDVIFGKFFSNWLMLRTMAWDDMLTTQSTYVPDARNLLHNRFVNSSTCEWLMMLDSDVLPPPDFLDRLLEHTKNPDVRVVGGVYRKKGEPYEPCVYDFVNVREDGIGQWRIRTKMGKGLESVGGAGAGCWLMHRSAAEAIGNTPYNMNEGAEDLTICRKLHEKGFLTWIDWSIACAHTGVAIV